MIDPECWGIGDFVVYSWLLHTANANGRPTFIVPRRWTDILTFFGCDRWFHPFRSDTSIKEPPKGLNNESWLFHWLKEYTGLSGVPFVRPSVHEKACDAAPSQELLNWRGADRKPILLFPEVSQPAWLCREWPLPCYIELDRLLTRSGFRVITLFRNRSPVVDAFSHSVWGLPTISMCSLIARARMVVGNRVRTHSYCRDIGHSRGCRYGALRSSPLRVLDAKRQLREQSERSLHGMQLPDGRGIQPSL